MSSINNQYVTYCSKFEGLKSILNDPKVRLDLSKNNFVSNPCMLWNNLEKIIFSKIVPDGYGIMVHGSSKNSDLTIPISVAKNRLRTFLLRTQNQGNLIMW